MSKKILIDISPALDSARSGVGYYTGMLLSSLAYNNTAFELVGFYFNFLKRNKKNVLDYSSLRLKEIRVTPGKLIPLMKYIDKQPSLELFIKEKMDFILFTNYVALPSIRKTPYGLVVYDLSFIDHPEYLNDKNLMYLKKFVPKSIEKASLIITISEYTKKRILAEFPEVKSDIIVTPIPPAGSPVLYEKIPGRLSRLGVKKQKYILFLGTIEPRKNLANLIKSMGHLPKGYSLVLAGGKGWKDDEIRKAIDSGKEKGIDIIQTGYVTEEEKAALYNNAVVFVLPSHYEGFGMPILEAMQYRIPIAISDIPVFHEVAGDTAVYFDKDSPEDIAKKVSRLINDNKLQTNLIGKYKEQLAKFSWKKNAKSVLDAIDKVLEE